jgi:hypothetical protein
VLRPDKTTSNTLPTKDPINWRYAKLFLSIWSLVIFVPAAVVLLIDPFQVFHKSWLSKVFFYKDNERYQIAGVLKNYLDDDSAYNGVIIGTSISANITAADIASTLGWRVVNLSVRAAPLTERFYILKKSLEHSSVKHVLMEVYANDTEDDMDFIQDNSADFPAYLYNDSLRDKQHYVFNLSVFHNCWVLLRLNGWLVWMPQTIQDFFKPDINAWSEGDVGKWNVWVTDPSHRDAFLLFNQPANLQKKKQELATVRALHKKELRPWQTDYAFDIQKKCLVDVIKAHPDVQFDLWFAPVNLGLYASGFNRENINKNVEFRRFLVKSLDDQTNVRLFGFDNVLSITADMRNYMDYSHFSSAIQKQVLQDITHGNYRLTADNIDVYAEQFKNNILAFDIAVPATTDYLQNTK